MPQLCLACRNVVADDDDDGDGGWVWVRRHLLWAKQVLIIREMISLWIEIQFCPPSVSQSLSWWLPAYSLTQKVHVHFFL